MAPPIDLLGCTTAEGQFLQLMEALVNFQDDTGISDGANRDGVIVFTNVTMNDLTGFYSFSGNLPITTTGSPDGYTTIADPIFYPK